MANQEMIISTYYSTTTSKGTYMQIRKQSVYSEERLKTALDSAKKKTFEFLDLGLYTSAYEVYVHPKKASKPYLEKYQVSF